MTKLRRSAERPVIPTWGGGPFRILAIDPGGTTGYRYVAHSPNEPTVPTDIHEFMWEGGQIGPDEHHLELQNLLIQYRQKADASPLTIVCESFEFRQHINKESAKTGVNLISKEYIGIIKLFVETSTNVIVRFQTASAAKQLVPDKGPLANEKLRQLGLYTTANPHQNDATRHALRHMVINMKMRNPITNVWLRDDDEDDT